MTTLLHYIWCPMMIVLTSPLSKLHLGDLCRSHFANPIGLPRGFSVYIYAYPKC